MDLDLVSYTSSLAVDKIIATFTGTLVIPSGGSSFADHELPVAAGHTFWAGTYTLSGSTQQNDIGGLQYSNNSGVGLEARSYVGGIRILGQNSTGSPVTATYNISVIASPETGIVPTTGTFAPLVTKQMFDSRENHQKIGIDRKWGDDPKDTYLTETSSLHGPHGVTYYYLHYDESLFSTAPIFRLFFVFTDGYMYEASVAYVGAAFWQSNNVNIGEAAFVAEPGDYFIFWHTYVFNTPTPLSDIYLRVYYE